MERNRRPTRRGGILLACVIASLLLAGCAGIPNRYSAANITIVTDDDSVSGMHFVRGFKTQETLDWDVQQVGDMVANRLADEGVHDVSILVRLQQPGTPQTHYMNYIPNTWQILIYQK